MEYRRMRKDRSTVAPNMYVLDHMVFAFLFGFGAYELLPFLAPIAYMERSVVRVIVCMAVPSIFGILLTFSGRRTNAGTMMDIFTGSALYVAGTVGYYVQGIVWIIVLILVLFTVTGVALYVFGRSDARPAVLRTNKQKVRRCCLLFRRNLGLASVLLLAVIPFFLKMKSDEDVIRMFCLKTGYQPSYREGDYNLQKIYGEEYCLKAILDSVLPIRDRKSWRELSPADKKEIVELLCFNEANYLGLSHEIKIVFSDKLGEGTGGFYNADTHTVCFNQSILEKDSNEEAYHVIAHELRHAYQEDVIEVYARLKPEERGLYCFSGVDEWMKNSEKYISVKTDEDYVDYMEQPLEQDANLYAYSMWKTLTEQMDKLLKEREDSMSE